MAHSNGCFTSIPSLRSSCANRRHSIAIPLIVLLVIVLLWKYKESTQVAEDEALKHQRVSSHWENETQKAAQLIPLADSQKMKSTWPPRIVATTHLLNAHRLLILKRMFNCKLIWVFFLASKNAQDAHTNKHTNSGRRILKGLNEKWPIALALFPSAAVLFPYYCY